MPTRFPHGLSSYGIPVVGGLDIPANANVFFVDSGHASASNGNAGDDPNAPLATINGAMALCSATNGDHIFVMPGHAETVTTLSMNVAGVTVWGWGYGRARPAITGSGANDVVNVSAANCVIHNLRVIGATSVTALLNIAASGLSVDGCVFEHGAAPARAVTIASGADRFYFTNCKWLGTANGPTAVFWFEIGSSSISEWGVSDCMFNYLPNGLDRAVFVASNDAAPGGVIQNIVALGIDLEGLLVDFESSVSVGEGMFYNVVAQYRSAATITDMYDLGGYGMARIALSDGPNRAAILHPATSAT